MLHINKSGPCPSCPAENRLRVSGTDFLRFGVVHHSGPTCYSGHYTATVATQTSAYLCDDYGIEQQPDLLNAAWPNACLVFYENRSAADAGAPKVLDVRMAPAEGGDTHPAQEPEASMHPDESGDPGLAAAEDNSDDGSQEEGTDNDDAADMHEKIEADELHNTKSRHDDWLHRGPLLADLPFIVYITRVQQVRKPTGGDADYGELFFFDDHYPLSVLYCQQIRRIQKVAIPRIVGQICPPLEEEAGEAHARHKLMLFARTRCPGSQRCSDPLICRPWMIPSGDPDDDKTAAEMNSLLKSTSRPIAGDPEAKGIPKFLASWKACKCALEMQAEKAVSKEHASKKIGVIADTTTMKDRSSDSHPALRKAVSLRPDLI